MDGNYNGRVLIGFKTFIISQYLCKLMRKIETNRKEQSDSQSIVTDGGTNTKQSSTQKCNSCSRPKDVTRTVEAGTPVGNYLGLVGSSTTEMCNRCWGSVPETQDADFGLLEFEDWERQITTDGSRFVSATWKSDTHTVMLDAVGDGNWTVSWLGEEDGKTDEWYSQYEARQFAIDQIQRMIRLINSGMVSVTGE